MVTINVFSNALYLRLLVRNRPIDIAVTRQLHQNVQLSWRAIAFASIPAMNFDLLLVDVLV